MSITLRPITRDDLADIMRWRMDPDITRFMNTNPKLTMEGQLKWLASVSVNPDVAYWLIEVDGEGAGVINLTGLTDPSGNLGWGYYMGEKRLRSIKNALSLEMSMYDYALITLGKKAVYSDVFTLNKGVIGLHKLCGCEVVEELPAHVLKEGVYYDLTMMRMTAGNWVKIREEKKYEKISFTSPDGGPEETPLTEE